MTFSRKGDRESNTNLGKKQAHGSEDPESVEIFDNEILNVREVADLLRVSPKTAYRWIKRDRIPHWKEGNTIRVLRSMLIGCMKGDNHA